MQGAMFAKAILSLAIFTPAWGAHFRGQPTVNGTTQLVQANLTNKELMETMLGPFDSLIAACDYCEERERHQGAGKMPSPDCNCMAYPEDATFKMFCDIPPSNDGYVAQKGGCKCNYKENGGQTTCSEV